MTQLLAKSHASGTNVPYSATLLGHTQQCVDVAEFFGHVAGESMVYACGTREASHVSWFQKTLVLAAVVHDLGKATTTFQDQLRRHGADTPHYVRHEVVSYHVMANHDPVADALHDYFASGTESHLLPLVEGAVLSHHLKFPRPSVQIGPGRFYRQGEIRILGAELDRSGYLNILGQLLGSDVDLTSIDAVTGTEDWLRSEVKRSFQRKVAAQRYNVVETMLGAMLRGALIAVDTIGSLQFETRHDWLNCLQRLRASWYERQEFPQRLRAMVDGSIGFGSTHGAIDAFQDAVMRAGSDVVVVEAGCGMGKSIAAYKRAAYHESRGLFFTFPTTSVASQMYEEYGLEGDIGAQLLHGRSEVDMEFFLPPASVDEETESDNVEWRDTAESIRRLMSPSTFCTVDTVLGVLQLRRSSLVLLPVLCQSTLVFDEVHAYSNRLFEHLLVFVKRFHLPMLAMTASLAQKQRAALEEATSARRVCWIKGPESIEMLPRYHVHADTSGRLFATLPDEVLETIQDHVVRGQKVLVVMNQVEWAREVFEQLSAIPRLQPVTRLLHSRFKYVHRRHKQQALVECFRQATEGMVAVTTQICEMSFDISADLLVSHVAPFASMVQRLGRLNRGPSPKNSLGRAIFISAPSCLPYSLEDYGTGSAFLEHLHAEGRHTLSQADLAAWLHQSSDTGTFQDIEHQCTWFDPGTAVSGNSLREAGYTMDVIARDDFERSQTPTAKLALVLPLPFRRTAQSLARVWRHVTVVDDDEIDYSETMGGMWRRE